MPWLSSVSRLQDRLNLMIGVLLFFSPWVLGYTDLTAATLNAWICGVVISGTAVAALIALKEWEQWHGIALGGWIVIAPWVLGFAPITSVAVAHVMLGILLIASEYWEIWQVRHPHVA